MKDLRAHDVMCAEVVTISPKATFVEAAKLMLDHRISGLPVVNDAGQLVGVITEGDFLRRVELGTQPEDGQRWSLRLAHDVLKAHARYVEDIMTANVASVVEDTPLTEVADLLQLMRVKRVPVTRQGEVVGVISRADLLRILVSEVQAPEMQLAS